MRGLKPVGYNYIVPNITSHLLQMRGLKPFAGRKGTFAKVASFTDAWIETSSAITHERTLLVASFTDAWIETFYFRVRAKKIPRSHLLQMRGLKPPKSGYIPAGSKSHLLQMRGLKRCLSAIRRWADWSHLLQMRGLKRNCLNGSLTVTCRIFYRCVD